MQQHPVPRHITGFKFKLIGEMTLQQFGYVAVGCVLGYILFRTVPGPGFFRLVVGAGCAGFGAALAFLPIQGRPFDIWIKSFFKSIYSPSQYIWSKQNPPPAILIKPSKNLAAGPQAPLIVIHDDSQQKLVKSDFHETKAKLDLYLKKTQTQPHHVLDKKEDYALKKTAELMKTTGKIIPAVITPLPSPPTPVPEKQKPPEELINAFKEPSTPAVLPVSFPEPPEPKIPKPEPLPVKPAAPPGELLSQKVEEELEKKYQTEIENLKKEKQRIESELNLLRTEPVNKPLTTESLPKPAQISKKTSLRILTQAEATKAGFPQNIKKSNIITGVILDPQGQQLPNILVTVKDKSDMIVRALKTNNLGQFISSTPLGNGSYYIEIEDPKKRLTFDIIKIGLHGKTFPPIEILAKFIEEK